MATYIPEFGFIIIRHVNSEKTDLYWKECYSCIRKYYDYIILIIDDNSNPMYIKNDIELIHCIIIPSEFPKRGELLPYYYFHKYHIFENAIILHDSTFIQSKINIDNSNNVKFLWDFEHHWNDTKNEITMIHNMSKNNDMYYSLLKLYEDKSKWNGCFGVQSIINHSFLTELDNKYNFLSLIQYVTTREDRMSLERIFALICCHLKENKIETTFGDINNYTYNVSKYKNIPYNYTFDNYYYDKQNNRINGSIVKVRTGR
jgi:hypothetical protein